MPVCAAGETSARRARLRARCSKAIARIAVPISGMLLPVLAGPEPAGWFAGDIHVHRNCNGGSPVSLATLKDAMTTNNLAIISVRADLQARVGDLSLVNGSDDAISSTGRIVHWEQEWHWDPGDYPHQVVGGHLLPTNMSSAIWDSISEYTYPVFNAARSRNAVTGFAHLQYLIDSIPFASLDCCGPREVPVEAALGYCDFISEDVNWSNDYPILLYYRLLNCGFRPGLAAGTDYPCASITIGTILTYAQCPGGLDYGDWTDAIKNGRTVIARNGHKEFLALAVNGKTPGDTVKLGAGGSVSATATWTATQNMSGTVELIKNGSVVASKNCSVTSSNSDSLTANIDFSKSGWLCARRMGGGVHQSHTAAVLVIVNGAPIRASATDADFFIRWCDTLLARSATGGAWANYYPSQRTAARARYQQTRDLFLQIRNETAATAPMRMAMRIPATTPSAAVYDLTGAFIGRLDAHAHSGRMLRYFHRGIFVVCGKGTALGYLRLMLR